MAEPSGEQDRSEEATPFKLDRARRKGMLARGTDLGFLSVLVALAIVAQTAGQGLIVGLGLTMRRGFAGQIAMAGERQWIAAVAGAEVRALAALLAFPALVLLAGCVTVELIQNRGIVFSAEPLKPDFSKLNPARGLKRLFSMRMLKELAKNVVKLSLYAAAAVVFVLHAGIEAGSEVRTARDLGDVLLRASGRLLLMFIVLAALVAALDQILARREFAKQMRMSQREVKREMREREGEPRQKQKRKQILAEIMKQAAAATNVKGADVLIVNPVHFAVALRYRPEEMDAPVVQARGRDIWARRMRRVAEREGIAVVRHPALARALYRRGNVGRPIGQDQFVAVADIYLRLRRTPRQSEAG
jgi:flagellar biosynthetic protein FlhB